MSKIFAHRINTVDFDLNPTFDVEAEYELNTLLEEIGHHYSPGGYRLSIKDFDYLIDRVECPLLKGNLKRDRRWAEIRGLKYVHYYVIGDDWEGNHT